MKHMFWNPSLCVCGGGVCICTWISMEREINMILSRNTYLHYFIIECRECCNTSIKEYDEISKQNLRIILKKDE